MLLIFPLGSMHSCGTAGAKSEEGAGNGRSVWPERSGIHAAYNGWDNGMRLRKEELNLKTQSQFGLRVATHPHEAEIGSNRCSLYSGEYVNAFCTHRLSNHPNWVQMRLLLVKNESEPGKEG